MATGLKFACFTALTLVLHAKNNNTDSSVVFKTSTSVQQLTAMNKNPNGYSDLSCSMSTFVDNVENVWYHFVSENMMIGNGYQAVVSSIYDNQLNPYNNSLNPIVQQLPFVSKGILGFSFDQCSNPITNDIIYCYSGLPSNGRGNVYVYCKVFYNEDGNSSSNSSYWTNPFAVSTAMSAESSHNIYLSVICFDDAYFVSWLYAPLGPPQYLIYSLVDLHANIIQKATVMLQIQGKFEISSFGTIKAKFKTAKKKACFIVSYVYNLNLHCIMGEYNNYMVQFDSDTFNKQLKIDYPPNEGESITSFAPISMDVNDQCCYLIPYRAWSISEAKQSLYFTIVDITGKQILNDTLKDGDVLVRNGPKNSFFVMNELLELSMLNQKNNQRKYFISLYSLQAIRHGVAGMQSIEANVYSINNVDDSYSFETVSNDVSFVKNMKADEAFPDSICAHISPVNNDETLVLVWSELVQISKKVSRTSLFGQSWTVTNS